ncbi:MAG: hypothetical protein K8F62_16420 [Pseudorhodoplanes sp.]|nr:hypothetical protein [Pseudorhodoplanes sp.]
MSFRLIDLPGIDQDTVFNFTEAAVTSAGAGQNPGHLKHHHQRSAMSWIPPAGPLQCDLVSNSIWKQRSFRPFNNAAFCRQKICGVYA